MSREYSEHFDLTGKVALVTGAAQGLGAAITRALAAQGASCVACDLNFAALQAVADQSDGEQKTMSVQCDVQNQHQVQSCVDQVVAAFGRIDVLVNNAGIHRRVDPLEYDLADLEAIFQINLLGSFQMASAVGRVMIEQQSGSIINLSALGGGLVGLGRSGSAYGMSKGGIVAMTRDLAAEWGKHSIRVNALAPGWIKTPMTEALQNHPLRASKVLERVPLGRWGEADDVAGAAVFLASDASRYITGHTIPIDGGAANVIAISE